MLLTEQDGERSVISPREDYSSITPKNQGGRVRLRHASFGVLIKQRVRKETGATAKGKDGSSRELTQQSSDPTTSEHVLYGRVKSPKECPPR